MLSFLGSTFGLKGMAIAAGVALAVGLGGGWKVRDAFCDSAKAKSELARERATVKLMQERISVMQRAAEESAAQAVSDQERLEAIQRLILNTPANNNACLDKDAAERLGGIK